MKTQEIFKRKEIKYILTKQQADSLEQINSRYMTADKFGESKVRSIYLDTPTHILIRRSLEKPLYKEKFRIRFYGKAGADDKVFLEIKKKFDHIVYKRRVKLKFQEAIDFMAGSNEAVAGERTERERQILREMKYSRDFYGGLAPVADISYDRRAYWGSEDENLRLTFDRNICLVHQGPVNDGENKLYKILPGDRVLLEVKTLNGLPAWLRDFLSREHIMKTSFSKYGEVYRKYIIEGSFAYESPRERRVV